MKSFACFVTFYLVFVLFFKTDYVRSKKSLPLQEERIHKKSHSTTECVFGKQHKELGSSWFADLGPPFHVMPCIKCECLKAIKENRIFGHVKCRNIAKDCQELPCEDQIQVAGRCCKVCRNDTELIESMQDTPTFSLEEEEKSNKHYAALLTSTFNSLYKEDSANKGSTINSLGQIATGRFTLHKRNLYYSFYVSSYPIVTRPKSVQFVDNTGKIIEEQVLPAGSVYQNLTGKICGIWRRLPSEYRIALKEEKLSVILTWAEYDLQIRGALMRYGPLTTETFSSLMSSPVDSISNDAAGTAIVSISNVTPSVHVMVIFTGLFNFKRKSENSVHLRLVNDNQQSIIFEEVSTLTKPSSELNVIEYSTAVKTADLLALSQQRISVVLSLAKYNETRIFGKIIPRVTCELFQAVLSSSHINLANSKHPQKLTKASGVSWMFLDKNSALQFYVILDNIADVSIELVTVQKLELVEDLTSLNWTNRSLSYLRPKHLEQLYNEDLALNVAKLGSNNPSLIRGRLVSRPVTDSRDSAVPFLLKRSDTSVPADMVGLIWARIDGECNMHYDVSLAGREVENRQYELYLEDLPFQAPGAPVTRRLLEDFTGTNVEGYAYGLNHAELLRLKSGVVYLDIWDMKLGQSVLKTRWDKVLIPESCLPHMVDNSTADNNIPSYRVNNEESDQPAKCIHETQFYDHGAQWTSSKDDCVMCNCNLGVTKCDTVLCPPLNCTKNYTTSGACCPSCDYSMQVTNTTRSMCSIGGQVFAPGSTSYPYMPPNGFDTCTVCHCDPLTVTVKCRRIDCPPLDCDEKLALRPDPKSCCKICPNKTNKTVNYDTAISDQQNPITSEQDILLAGGCKYPYGGPYENGKEWHPKLYFHGVERCVTCRCKDGNVRCERKKCTKRSCDDLCCMNKERCVKLRKLEKIQQ